MRVHSFLNAFDVLLLDVNGTFMFGQDRFGPDQDYATTYRTLGGRTLSDGRVDELVGACIERLTVVGRDSTRDADFPSITEVLRETAAALEADQFAFIARVIAAHELGMVPPSFAAALHVLAQNHRLVVVSNIWSEKAPWHRTFQEAGIEDLFQAFIWSSDGHATKPAPELFERAIAAAGVPRNRIAFVGDHPRRDIEGAVRVGLATVWIDDGTRRPPSVSPGLTIGSLLELTPAG
ncbi:MAG: HAD-IA family hydrolase [Alphaproteobacteria bacterium]|nr:HAD-IA family hydrolase [Alphaproteobacteria bacterium]